MVAEDLKCEWSGEQFHLWVHYQGWGIEALFYNSFSLTYNVEWFRKKFQLSSLAATRIATMHARDLNIVMKIIHACDINKVSNQGSVTYFYNELQWIPWVFEGLMNCLHGTMYDHTHHLRSYKIRNGPEYEKKKDDKSPRVSLD